MVKENQGHKAKQATAKANVPRAAPAIAPTPREQKKAKANNALLVCVSLSKKAPAPVVRNVATLTKWSVVGHLPHDPANLASLQENRKIAPSSSLARASSARTAGTGIRVPAQPLPPPAKEKEEKGGQAKERGVALANLPPPLLLQFLYCAPLLV